MSIDLRRDTVGFTTASSHREAAFSTGFLRFGIIMLDIFARSVRRCRCSRSVQSSLEGRTSSSATDPKRGLVISSVPVSCSRLSVLPSTTVVGRLAASIALLRCPVQYLTLDVDCTGDAFTGMTLKGSWFVSRLNGSLCDNCLESLLRSVTP